MKYFAALQRTQPQPAPQYQQYQQAPAPAAQQYTPQYPTAPQYATAPQYVQSPVFSAARASLYNQQPAAPQYKQPLAQYSQPAVSQYSQPQYNQPRFTQALPAVREYRQSNLEAVHQGVAQPAQIPAGVDPQACPNYPFCHS